MEENFYLKNIRERIEPFRQAVIQHPVFAELKDMHDVRIFMQHHVFAVWDFMSLLKSLQVELTCVQIPWVPKGKGDLRYLINEIVTGEESDVDAEGNRLSHFELYLKAMDQCGADRGKIDRFLSSVMSGDSVAQALRMSGATPGVCEFVDYTFDIIGSKKPHLLAAVFTYGREDLIPEMFLKILQEISTHQQVDASDFTYYVERHIEVDGGHHGHLALRMVEQLCEERDAYWEECTTAAIAALQKRVRLWDGVLQEIREKRTQAIVAGEVSA